METDLVCCRCVEVKAVGVEALAASPDSRWLAVARSNATVEIYDTATNSLSVRLSDESCTSTRSLLWVPASPRAAVVAYEAAAAKAGEYVSFTERRRALAAKRGAEETDYEKDDFACDLYEWRLLTAGLHGVVSEWNLRTLRIQSETPSYGGAIFSLSAPPHGAPANFFAAACDDGRVRLFAVQGAPARAALSSTRQTPAARKHTDSDSESDSDDDGIEGADEDGILLKASLPKTAARLLSVSWYAPGLLFAATAASTILRFSASTLSASVSLSAFTSHLGAGTFVADGKMILVNASQTRQVNQQKGESGDEKLNGKKGSSAAPVLVWCLYSLPSVHLLLSGDSSGCVTVWSVPTCVALRRLQLHAADVLNLEAHAVVPVGGSDREDRNGELKRSLPRDRAIVTVVSCGVDGKLSIGFRQKDGDWTVGPAKYPHACDIRGLALLPPPQGSAGNRKRLVHLAPPSSLVAWTGAVDGVVRCTERLTGISRVRGPAPTLPFDPLAAGVLPHINVAASGRDGLVLACSDNGLELWNISPLSSSPSMSLLSSSPLASSTSLSTSSPSSASIVKLLRVSLRDSLRPQCGDIAPDGTLVAAGSRRGLHLFGLHLKELEVVDVEGGSGCDSVRDVRALRFISDTVLVCCCSARPKSSSRRRFSFSSQKEGSTHTSRTDAGEGEGEEDAEGNGAHANKTRTTAVSLAAAAIESEWNAVRDTGAEERFGSLSGGAYRVVCLDVWRGGKVLGELGVFPYPVRSFETSDDGALLSCLFSSGSLVVVSLADFSPLRFFPAFPLSAGMPIVCACFSPSPSEEGGAGEERRGERKRKICLFSSQRQYCVVPLLDDESAGGERTERRLKEAARNADGQGDVHGRGEKKIKIRQVRLSRICAYRAFFLADSSFFVWASVPGRMLPLGCRCIPAFCIAPSDGPIVSAVWLDKSALFSPKPELEEVTDPCSPQSCASLSSSSSVSASLSSSSVLLCLTPSVVCHLPLSSSSRLTRLASPLSIPLSKPVSCSVSSCARSAISSASASPAAQGSNARDEDACEGLKRKRRRGKSGDSSAVASSSGSSGSEAEEEEAEEAVNFSSSLASSTLTRGTVSIHIRRAPEALCPRSLAAACSSSLHMPPSPFSASFASPHVSIAPLPLYASGRPLRSLAVSSPLHNGVFELLSPSMRHLHLLHSQLSSPFAAGRRGCARKKKAFACDEESRCSAASSPSPRTSLSTTCSSPSSFCSGFAAFAENGRYDGVLSEVAEGKKKKRQKRADGGDEEESRSILVAERQAMALERDRQGACAPLFHDKSRFFVLRRSPGHGFLSLLCVPQREEKKKGKRVAAENRAKKEEEQQKTRQMLMIVEALEGAAGEPEGMPAPFNRKRYGT
ncbi:hypothetical protein BESB_058840 [Besnoitia besnoiti]|uniref:WD domain, G-beta repeat-containing protein n=1 Tax=Besnoitia besnoiti TaxID=94643 RepID=A0A2A9MHD3_BESBE|nr:hypothetical protein BESB_058840 [Besnoitia besnoiti]PFH34997.1 hypothetical protein BESB_058840 [Besnoitia besnoiti]